MCEVSALQQNYNEVCKIITDIIERIEEFRQSLRLSREEFCREVEFPYGTYSSYVSKRASAPSLRLITQITKRYDANVEWMVTGKGDMLASAQHTTARSNGSEPYGDEGPGIDVLAARITALKETIRNHEGRTIPIAWDRALQIVLEGLPDDQARRVVRGVVEKLMSREEAESVREDAASS